MIELLKQSNLKHYDLKPGKIKVKTKQNKVNIIIGVIGKISGISYGHYLITIEHNDVTKTLISTK